MSALSNKIRKSRHISYQVEGGPKLLLIRPTLLEFMAMSEEGVSHADIARRFTIGWEGVRECDIIKGGTTDEIPFDSDAWAEWLDDNGEWWLPIGDKVIKSFNEYMERKEVSKKNS